MKEDRKRCEKRELLEECTDKECPLRSYVRTEGCFFYAGYTTDKAGRDRY